MNWNTFISGMVKLCQTPDKSSSLFVPEANLINTSLSLLLINPSVFPVTLRTFSFHQFELWRFYKYICKKYTKYNAKFIVLK